MLVDFDGEILLPKGNVEDFAVIACDQFTSQPEYWTELERRLKSGSALDFVLPECFLDRADELINKIRAANARIDDRFYSVRGAVAVTRTTAYGRTRKGVVASIDLDAYEFTPGNKALIRASERTVKERIPPRVAIREALDIELPHVLLLVDDRFGALSSAVERAKKRALYDGELNGRGGHIKGELIENSEDLYAAVDGIIRDSARFGSPLFALVGDGNHSLATAKYCRDACPTKSNGRALVEIINVYDEGLVCEPIHRLVKVDDTQAFVSAFRKEVCCDGDAAETVIYTPSPVTVRLPADKIAAIKAVDAFCENYVKKNGGYVDYVHGESGLKRDGFCGIMLHSVKKSELFDYVIANGVLPKKTFSLGEAEEKRFYIEARKIK